MQPLRGCCSRDGAQGALPRRRSARRRRRLNAAHGEDARCALRSRRALAMRRVKPPPPPRSEEEEEEEKKKEGESGAVYAELAWTGDLVNAAWSLLGEHAAKLGYSKENWRLAVEE